MAHTVTLVKHIPEGLPMPEHFEIRESTMPTPEEVEEGGVLIKVLVMSADPYLRPACKSEAKGGPVPRPMAGFVTGRVLSSKRDGWVEGDLFGASLPFTTFQIVSAEALEKTIMWKLTDILSESDISKGIGALGMPGSTAYGGLIDVLRPLKCPEGEEKDAKAPEVIWVSGAAGAVGGMVGMIAKQIYGCTVIGSCGGPEKCALIKSKFGFDHAIDYKATDGSAEALAAKIRECCPDGIDMYFDNVGGAHFEAAMATLRPHGRVAVCGGICHYNEGEERVPDRFFPTDLIYSFQRVEGFMCMPWLSGQRGAFLKDMARWVGEGKVAVEETKFCGVGQWPAAFQSLFTGGNTGKVVIDVSAD